MLGSHLGFVCLRPFAGSWVLYVEAFSEQRGEGEDGMGYSLVFGLLAPIRWRSLLSVTWQLVPVIASASKEGTLGELTWGV